MTVQEDTPNLTRMNYGLLSLFLLSFISAVRFCHALDTIGTTVFIQEGQSLISAKGTYELGFFNSSNDSRRYVGIWYKKITVRTVIWVANRFNPLTGSPGVLKVTPQGSVILQEMKGTGEIFWTTNSPAPNGGSPVAQLLDTGNLVVSDGVGGNILWQSFDYPTDTLLADMKLGRNTMSGFNRFLTAWSSPDDPYPGNYTFKLDPRGYPQLLLEQGDTIKFSSGPWNGIRWSGTPILTPNSYFTYELVLTNDEMYYHYQLKNDMVITRLSLNSSGVLQRYTWIDRMQGWQLYLSEPIDNCDTHSLCGPYGSCNINNSPVCGCLEGFNPKIPSEWDLTDWTTGCVRRTEMECGKEIFVKYPSIRLPDTQHSWFNRSMNLQECKAHCRSNCWCMAYSSLDISQGGVGTGCLEWTSDLIDIREYKENGQDLYIRMSASETGLLQSTKKKHKVTIVAGVASAVVVHILALLLFFGLNKFRKKDLSKTVKGFRRDTGQDDEGHNEDLELPLFDMATIAAATDNFSLLNKIGEGGFGPVYKGKLSNGQDIAVKKLSSKSKQGLEEFKNEVLCVAKLQHRNLVKLFGCCTQEENLLVYEYMPNKSLDLFLFDQEQRKKLDWSKRFNIVNGIARGILYLHQDSRLRIIHRDLKASNILLDSDMNPKISDFGLAKSFRGNQMGANTNRVFGTYGYMSPEYAIDGVFSIKSDVFSYGVLVLETVCGKRNRGFNHPDHHHNLLGHAWRLFSEGKPLDLVDPLMVGSCNMSEAARCIQIGLLCVQRCPEDRPTMAKVVMMLGSEIELPVAKEPGFFNERKLLGDECSSTSQAAYSANEITMTLLTGR